MLESGKRGVVARIHGGERRREHLLSLGIVPGVPVRVVRGGGSGPLVVDVLGGRVILGNGIACAVDIA